MSRAPQALPFPFYRWVTRSTRWNGLTWTTQLGHGGQGVRPCSCPHPPPSECSLKEHLFLSLEAVSSGSSNHDGNCFSKNPGNHQVAQETSLHANFSWPQSHRHETFPGIIMLNHVQWAFNSSFQKVLTRTSHVGSFINNTCHACQAITE